MAQVTSNFSDFQSNRSNGNIFRIGSEKNEGRQDILDRFSVLHINEDTLQNEFNFIISGLQKHRQDNHESIDLAKETKCLKKNSMAPLSEKKSPLVKKAASATPSTSPTRPRHTPPRSLSNDAWHVDEESPKQERSPLQRSKSMEESPVPLTAPAPDRRGRRPVPQNSFELKSSSPRRRSSRLASCFSETLLNLDDPPKRRGGRRLRRIQGIPPKKYAVLDDTSVTTASTLDSERSPIEQY